MNSFTYAGAPAYPSKMTIKTIPPNAKYIVMSDCHRGDGSAADEFAHNSLIYKCALEYYLKEGFTYIELGDAEELWANDAFEQIYITHTFANLSLTERRFLETGIGTRGVRRKEKADPVYYNAGSCVHPRCITGIEITAVPPKDDGLIHPHFTLMRWGYLVGDEVCTAAPTPSPLPAPSWKPGK